MTELKKNRDFKLIKEVEFDKYFKANEWEDYNRQFFNGLAKKYDATNVMHSLGTKKLMDRAFVNRLAAPAAAKILDLCAGSGDISIQLAKKFPDAMITALDASEQMLEQAKIKATAAGCHNIEFVVGDAMNLPYDNESYDLVTISFGLRNLKDIVAGLKEMKRVTKSGGMIANIDQGKPKNWLFKLIYKLQFYYIAPFLGKLIFHRGEFNSFKYLAESNKYFPNQEEMIAIFQSVGLNQVVNYNYWFGAVAQQVGKVGKN